MAGAVLEFEFVDGAGDGDAGFVVHGVFSLAWLVLYCQLVSSCVPFLPLGFFLDGRGVVFWLCFGVPYFGFGGLGMSDKNQGCLFLVWLAALFVMLFVLRLSWGWAFGASMVVLVVAMFIFFGVDEREATARGLQERQRQYKEAEAQEIRERLRKQEEELKDLRRHLNLSEDESRN